MIEVNLLPLELRRAERTPLPRLLVILVGTVTICILAVLHVHVQMLTNRVKNDIAKEKKAMGELQKEVAALEPDKRKRDEFALRKQTVRREFDKRVCWSKKLWELRRIVDNHSKTITLLWLSKLKTIDREKIDFFGRQQKDCKVLRIEGFAYNPELGTTGETIGAFAAALGDNRDFYGDFLGKSEVSDPMHIEMSDVALTVGKEMKGKIPEKVKQFTLRLVFREREAKDQGAVGKKP